MKPRIFIGSSKQQLKVANAFQQNLATYADCQVWPQESIPASTHSLDSLLDRVNEHDFGIFVFGDDDEIKLPDNCKNLRIPSDLDGFTNVFYSPKHPSGPVSGTAVACEQIIAQIERNGILRQLSVSVRLLSGSDGEKLTFKHKVWISVRNESRVDVVLHAGLFTFRSGVKPHPKLQCLAGGREVVLKFPGTAGHSEREFLLKSHATTTTFVALAPDMKPDEQQKLLDKTRIGSFRFDGCWLGDIPSVRHYDFET